MSTHLPLDALQSDALVLKLLSQLHPSVHPTTLYRVAAKCSASARQAIAFEVSAPASSWQVRPLLEYYALLQWLKALLHLSLPDYPASSAVLQHGMSTRRQKRDNYRWPLEAIYLHKQGVLQSFYALPAAQPISSTPPALPSQLVIGNLLAQVTGMRDSLAWFYPQFAAPHAASAISIGGGGGGGGTRSGGGGGGGAATAIGGGSRGGGGSPLNLGLQPGPPASSPSSYPEWLTHFVLLFSLSSLCRYSPVEWSDITLWSNEIDAYLVRQFLNQPRFQFRLVDFMDGFIDG